MKQEERISILEGQVKRLTEIADQYAENESRVLTNIQSLIESAKKQATISQRMLEQRDLEDLARTAARTGNAEDLETYLKARRKGQ